MNLSVYVGPYIEAWNFDEELIYEHESIVYDGRGELGSYEVRKYLIPNRKLPGVDRQMSFSKNDDMPVFAIPAISHEIARFEEMARPFTSAVLAAEGECRITWGVVCGMN
jgi:hypothetical protein